jgi:hypothetical protein
MTDEKLIAMAYACLADHELQERPFCDGWGCWDVLQAYRAGKADWERLIEALESIHEQAVEAIRIHPPDWSGIYQIEADARAVLVEVQGE